MSRTHRTVSTLALLAAALAVAGLGGACSPPSGQKPPAPGKPTQPQAQAPGPTPP